jgi:gas vesicle protein GvpO
MASNGKRGGSSGGSSGRGTRGRSQGNGKVNPAELAKSARAQLADLTGRVPESVLGLRKDDDGWKVTVEIVELSRVPNSTDLLGCYVVTLDDDGELVGYERVRRYQRGQAGGEE